MAITPDGSRGPLYQAKGGLIVLARLSGCPVLPVSWECSRAWRLNTWDQFIIPKPFSLVTVRVGEPYFVGRNHSPDEFEQERRHCEQALMTLEGAKQPQFQQG